MLNTKPSSSRLRMVNLRVVTKDKVEEETEEVAEEVPPEREDKTTE